MKSIAVVEDERFMREELSDILRKAGYQVEEITEFDHVADDLMRLAPDLVLLDLNLPQVNGFQICREIKRKSALPVLILTSRDQMRDELHALDLGATEAHQIRTPTLYIYKWSVWYRLQKVTRNQE